MKPAIPVKVRSREVDESGTDPDPEDLPVRRLAAATVAVIMISGLGIQTSAEPASAGTVDGWAEADFVQRINDLRVAWGRAPLQRHTVLIRKARGWSQTMANNGHISHSNLRSGITVPWSVLGENVGVGPSVASLHDALIHSSGHLANILDARFNYIGVGVVKQGGRMWVTQSFMRSNTPSPPKPLVATVAPKPKPPPPPPVRAIQAAPGGGYYVLHGNGRVEARGSAKHFGQPSFGFDIARDLAVMPDGQGYVVLDGFGGLHRYGSAAQGTMKYLATSYWPGWDIANSIAITADGKGVLVLDGWGGLHASGNAPRVAGAYWRGWDIARAVALDDAGGVYLLDGWGGVHTRNGATFRGAPYTPGKGYARDLEPMPDGSGYAVLDGWGSLRTYGAPPPKQSVPVMGGWMGLDRHAGRWWGVRNDGTAALI
ncbi:MAG: CAP domain-containing protein [Acidimicrobiia bacterium]